MTNDQNREFFELRGPWRATLALALHIGFLALPGALVLGLLAVAALSFRYDAGSGLRAAVAAATVAVPLGVGLHMVLSSRTRPRGAIVERAAQPQLWRMAEALASAMGAPNPDEIRITSEPNAGVREDTTLLGLRTRGRYLEIGLPLIAGLTVSEIRAVVAHELGHLAGPGKVTAIAHRALVSVRRTASGLVGGPTKWLFGGYARLYTAIASTTSHDVELAADAVAVKVAGKRSAVTALRKTTAIELGWSDYADEYLSMATDLGHAPDVLLGFRSFLEHPQRKKELAERSKRTIAEEEFTESLPTVRERLDRMKRLPTTERKQDERPAFALLRNPRESVPELEDRLMVDGLAPRVPWPEMARRAGAAHVERQAGMLSSAMSQSGVGPDPAIGAVLAAIHRGQGADLINPVLNPGLSPDHVAEAAVDTLTELLGGAVVDALVCAGRAHHELDWAGASLVRLTTGGLLDPNRLVRPAVADPRLVPGLHRTLVELGVPLHHSRPPAEEPDPVLSGIVSSVQYAGGTHDLLVTDRGLLLLPTSSSATQRLLAAVLTRVRRAEDEQLAELEGTPVASLRERSDAQWVDSRDVASAQLVQQRWGWSLTLELYLDECSMSSLDSAGVHPAGEDTVAVKLRSTADSEERNDPYGGLGEMIGARMHVDDQRGGSEQLGDE
jgi:Zn-dependent protease with chaperone function